MTSAFSTYVLPFAPLLITVGLIWLYTANSL
jgi:hypothetical protein